MAFPYLTDVLNHYFGTNIHLPLATFGAFVALAILVAMHIATREVTRLQNKGAFNALSASHNTFISKEIISELTFVCVVAGVVGAKLFDVIEHPVELLANPLSVLFSTGGFSIYGGLLLGGAAGFLFIQKKSIDPRPMLDACAPALALGYGIGRLGCQVSGDGDWGSPSTMELKPSWLPNWLWAQTYDGNVLGIAIPPPGVYPTPLYEAIASFTIFLVLWCSRKKLQKTGELFAIYLLLSGFERLLIEKIRINIEYSVFGVQMTQAQLISVALIVTGSIILLKTSQLNYPKKLLFSAVILGTLTACTRL